MRVHMYVCMYIGKKNWKSRTVVAKDNKRRVRREMFLSYFIHSSAGLHSLGLASNNYHGPTTRLRNIIHTRGYNIATNVYKSSSFNFNV